MLYNSVLILRSLAIIYL